MESATHMDLGIKMVVISKNIYSKLSPKLKKNK